MHCPHFFKLLHSPKSKKTAKSAVKKAKPVPSIGEGGVEDDEAEDLGVNVEGGSAKSDEKSSNEADSDEETPKKKDDAEQDDKSDEDESKEDDESQEGRDGSGALQTNLTHAK